MVTDKTETKNEKFVRLAEKRVSVILKGLDVLENLTSAQYESNEQERAEIIKAIENKFDKLKIAFSGVKENKQKERTFVFTNE